MSRGMPSMTALLGLLALAGYQNRDKLAELLKGAGSSGNTPPGSSNQQGPLRKCSTPPIAARWCAIRSRAIRLTAQSSVRGPAMVQRHGGGLVAHQGGGLAKAPEGGAC